MDAQLIEFLIVTTILVLTPGAATAVVVRNVIARGHRGGVEAAVGAAIGNTSQAALAALGLSALFLRYPVAGALLRYGGALYLAFLGFRNLALAWRGGDAAPRRRTLAGGSLRQGLVTALLNPPVSTYYLAVVPSFLPEPGLLQRRFVLYAAIHVSMAFAYHLTWTAAMTWLGGVWARPAARRTMEVLTGAALLYLAFRVSGF